MLLFVGCEWQVKISKIKVVSDKKAGIHQQFPSVFASFLSRQNRLPLFVNIPDCDAARILEEAHGRVKHFDIGAIIVSECDVASELIVMMSGSASVQLVGVRDGDRVEVQRLVAGDLFGMSFVAVKPETYPAMLVANTKCEVLLLSLGVIRQWLVDGKHFGFLANMYAAMSKDAYFAWRKLMLLSCYRISDRLLMFLRWRANDGMPEAYEFTYPGLANTLGVNRTALYRAVASLERSRKVVVANGTIRLR